jgi:hypothetical protein
MSLLTEISSAAELQEQLDKLQSADANLSPKGVIAEAKRLGGDDKQADLVIQEIESGSSDGQQLQIAFNRLSIMIRSFSRTSVLRPEKMSVYLGDAVEALARMQVGRASMMLAVVRKLVAAEPQLWGAMDSPTSHATKVAKAKEQLEAACKKIEQAVTLDDLTIHQDIASQDRDNGMSRITFRITGDTLHLGDGRDIGARLTSWWLANDGSTKKRKVA